MPTITIEMLEGRTQNTKRELVAAITEATTLALDCDPEVVSIRIYELSRALVARGGKCLDEQ